MKSGYQIEAKLGSAPGVTTYRGRRKSDGMRVLLKVLHGAGAGSAELARFKHRYESLTQTASPHLLTVHEVDDYEEGLLVVQEELAGPDLAAVLHERKTLPLAEALAIVQGIAEGLAAVHARGLIHGDVRPHNVQLDDRGGVKLVGGSGIDAELTRAHEALYDPRVLADVLPYLAPEQTGRMNRGVDSRADLYALGVVLFQLLTGQPPFQGSDPMEIVHAHLALPAPPLSRFGVDAPEAVSGIVNKLLAKHAEDRYHSVDGLLADLERCRRELREHGRVEPFLIGQADRKGVFQIHQRLYGRQPSIEALTTAFSRVLDGERQIVLVSGYSGIGKSALVLEILKPLARQKGYFTSGKYDQFNRDTPYGAVIQAFDGLLRQILTESEARIRVWRQALLDVLGTSGQVICDVIPSLERILGEQPPVAPMGPVEAQNRFNRLFSLFVSVFARRAHPLVLFLDDLQWVDPASLGLLRTLLADASLESFFFCGAFRDNEVGPGHPFARLLEEMKRGGLGVKDIVLGPLLRPHLLQLLTDSLERSDCEPLADAVLRKTGGNPFFVRSFLRSLYDHGALTFAAKSGWRWDLLRIDELAYTDNVVDLMVRTIQRLPAPTQEALKLAAAVGNRFSLETLGLVGECSAADACARLDAALTEGLLVAVRDVYRFVHDKVQEAAYSLIPLHERPAFHLRVGRLLSHSLDLADARALFEVVGHLNGAGALIADPAERLRLAQLNLDAATRAEESSAFSAAERFLEAGLERLPSDAWSAHRALRLAFGMKQGLMKSLCGRHDEALVVLAECLANVEARLERTQVRRLTMNVQILRNDLPAALAEGLAALRLFGIDLPPFPDDAAYDAQVQTTLALAGDDPLTSLGSLPRLEDPELLALQDVLQEFFSPGYFLATNNYGITIAKILENTLRYGGSPNAVYAAVNFGALLCVRGDIDLGYRFGQAALRLNELYPDRRSEAMLHNMWGAFLQHWKLSYAAYRETLLAGMHVGVETGQYIWSFYCLVNIATNGFLRGLPLLDVIAEVRSLKPISKLDRFNAITWMADAVAQIAEHLMKPAERPLTLVGQHIDIEALVAELTRLQSHSALYFTDFYIILLLVFQGAFTEGARVADRARPTITGVASWHGTPAFYFYAGVALTRGCEQSPPEERARYIEKAQALARQLGRWAQHGPETLGHRSVLLDAEILRLGGDARGASDRYDEGIALAQKGRFVHDEALGNELCARHHLALGRTTFARAYLLEAYRLWEHWGATEAQRRMEREYGELLLRTARRATPLGGEFDLGSVLKASQALSGELVLSRLLDRLMRVVGESVGARRSVLILERSGTLYVEAEHHLGEGEVRVLLGTPLEQCTDLAISLVTYVARVREPLVLDEHAAEGDFGHDPYLATRRPRSVVASPIVYQGRLAGVIYLENDLTSLAFTSERLEVVRLLSAQIAISIENALLVAELEAKVKERTHALTQAHEEILSYERAEQTRKEREVADQREVIEQQKAIIRALSSPIIQIWDGVLTVPLTGMLEADRAVQMMERLLDEIIKTRARYAILDLTGVDVVDTSTADHLVRIIRAIELLGAKAVISGIRSAVAQTMISLGVDLRRIITLRNMRDALRFCMSQQLPAHQ